MVMMAATPQRHLQPEDPSAEAEHVSNASGLQAQPTITSLHADRDAWELARSGKKQVLERRFGLVSMIGFCCSLMTTWEGTIINVTFGLTNGGPAGLIWGFIICWVGTTSVFISMGELASMLPNAAGQYLWVSVLSPPEYRRFLSYVTGWVTIVAWLAAPTVASYVAGSLIQNLAALNYTSYQPQPWQGLLIMYAVLLLALALNTVLGTLLPYIEVLILIIHLFGFLAILIPLTTIGRLGNAKEIFTSVFNYGGWSSNGLAFFVGLYGNAGAFTGTDGAIHMAEEIRNSSVNTPRSMMLAISINGVLGFVILVTFLLFAGNLEEILKLESEFPFMDILLYAIKDKGGATVLISLLVAMITCSIVAIMSSASRMIWSFAREQALPGWSQLRKINRRTSIPTYPSYVVVVIAMLLGLINLGSTTTFNALLSLVLEGFYGSYLICLSLLLYRRWRGDIQDQRSEDGTLTLHEAKDEGIKLAWGPWNLKGAIGTANNAFAVAYLVVIMFFGFWPPNANTTPENMNYSVLVLGGVAILSMAYYLLRARKHYTGPRVEVEIRRL